MDVMLETGKIATRRLVLNMAKYQKAWPAAIKYLKAKGIECYTVINIGTAIAIYF